MEHVLISLIETIKKYLDNELINISKQLNNKLITINN